MDSVNSGLVDSSSVNSFSIVLATIEEVGIIQHSGTYGVLGIALT
jgi:hypothetical protein